ncbi:MAG TPA: SpoIID/LytB domain-containing protein [Mycobacteriales bacterium]
MLRRRDHRRRPTVTALVAVGTVTAACLVATGASPSRAASPEIHYAVNGAYAFTGHGYGHGHGMSQWGADGAAQQGLSSSQILAFYYPGTTTGTVANTTVRVSVTGVTGGVTVLPTTRSGALSVIADDQPAPQVLPTDVNGAPVSQWRVLSTAGVQSLQGFWSGAWQPYPPTGGLSTTAAMGFRGANSVVSALRADGTVRDYRGDLVLQSTGGVRAVDRVPLESYLRSVTPSESPASWPAAALQAQAVAARTYTVHSLSSSSPYDICDSTQCQVYNGIAAYSATGTLIQSYEAPTTDAAVAVTAGQILLYNGTPILAQFSSSDGGWTSNGGEPYLPAQPDPYDGVVPNSGHDWTATVSAAQVGAAVGVGSALSITVNSRDGNGDWGGRTTSVTVAGVGGTVTLSGTGFRTALGLKSEWWTLPVGSPPNPQLAGVDLYAIRATGSGSGWLDLHTLSASSGYQTYTRHNITGMPQRPTSNWTYLIAPYNGDGQPDLYAICLRGCASGRVEVHVLSAASNYSVFLAHIATGLGVVPASQHPEVHLASYAGDGREDLFLVIDHGTGSGRVEVHVLSAASGYTTFLAHAATALVEPPAGQGWDYLIGDAVGSGDLVAIHDTGTTGSGATEVHVLSEQSGYQTFTAHDATILALGTTTTYALGSSADTGVPDLYVVLPNGASKHAEVHVLSGGSAYRTFLAHVATPLVALPTSDWALTFG